MADLIIKSIPMSNFGQSVCMLAIEKGVPYVFEFTKPQTDGAKAIHPFGKIPVMQHGDITLCESTAMAHYIDAAFEGPKFFPEDPAVSAKVDEWASLHCTIFDQSMIRKYALGYLLPGTEDGKPSRKRIDSALKEMKGQMAFLDEYLEGKEYFVGATLTYADLAMFPTLKAMLGFPESKELVKSHANVSRFIRMISERESAQKVKI
ncbi:MAG: glutathione S-transferase family protein [Kordiimonadaceae bacterium]|nr:glutathione S-transferase family protein [Kordiimonadaceae bacterium]